MPSLLLALGNVAKPELWHPWVNQIYNSEAASCVNYLMNEDWQHVLWEHTIHVWNPYSSGTRSSSKSHQNRKQMYWHLTTQVFFLHQYLIFIEFTACCIWKVVNDCGDTRLTMNMQLRSCHMGKCSSTLSDILNIFCWLCHSTSDRFLRSGSQSEGTIKTWRENILRRILFLTYGSG